MKFCTRCKNKLYPVQVDDDMVYVCKVCNLQVPFTDSDYLLRKKIEDKTSNVGRYMQSIRSIANDRVCEKVAKECDKCKLPFMNFATFGDEKISYFICSCGNVISY